MKHKSHKYPDRKKDESLEKKAGKIFAAMEYEVEYDRCFSGSKLADSFDFVVSFTIIHCFLGLFLVSIFMFHNFGFIV